MKKFSIFFVFSVIAAFSFHASADVPPPNTEGCQNAKADDSCKTDDGDKGVCVTDSCSGLDYSHLTDAGNPTSRTYDCLVCTQNSDDCSFAPHAAQSDLLAVLIDLIGL